MYRLNNENKTNIEITFAATRQNRFITFAMLTCSDVDVEVAFVVINFLIYVTDVYEEVNDAQHEKEDKHHE